MPAWTTFSSGTAAGCTTDRYRAVMLSWLKNNLYRHRSRVIWRGVDNRESDDPAIEAYRDAMARGVLGADFTLHQFYNSGRMPWRDRWLDFRLARMARRNARSCENRLTCGWHVH